MTYTNTFFTILALAAGASYIVAARRPENAGFQFFRKDAFFACSVANGLFATPIALNHFQFVKGYSPTLLMMMAGAVVLLLGLSIYNVRKAGLLFGLASSGVQIVVFSVAFPLLVVWLAYQAFLSVVSGAAGSDEYDRVHDPLERYGVSEDELRGEGLFDHDRVNS